MEFHYIYKHLNKKTGLVFYIGISNSKNYYRAYSSYSRNKKWHEYVKENEGFDVEIIINGISKEAACLLEKELITKYGRIILNNGCLVNISSGGQNGLYGIPRTKEHQDKIANAKRGKKLSDESRARISAAKTGIPSKRKGTKCSNETKLKLSIAAKGKKGYWTGKKRDKKVIDAIIKANTGRIPPNKGVSPSKETRDKISNSLKGNKPWNKGLKIK